MTQLPLFLEYKGVKVYHTYRDGDRDAENATLNQYHYTLYPDYGPSAYFDEQDDWFDIRDLKAYKDWMGLTDVALKEEQLHQSILRFAIQDGELKAPAQEKGYDPFNIEGAPRMRQVHLNALNELEEIKKEASDMLAFSREHDRLTVAAQIAGAMIARATWGSGGMLSPERVAQDAAKFADALLDYLDANPKM
jgi:hypothetical protein